MALGVDITKIVDTSGDEHKLSASITGAIPYAQVDNTSTSTAYTATVPGITELKDGTCVMLKNGVVTSEAGFTINVNGLGAYPSFTNLAAATQDTTLFNINYTMLFVFDSTRNSGAGGWICYRGYDANTNTLGYQLRTNSMSLAMESKVYRYRLLFTSPDGKKFVPANTSSSSSATASKTVNQSKIDPFGHIVYYGSTTAIDADSRPGTSALWSQYAFNLGYSFNRTGSALTMTSWNPVFVKAAPQTDGSAIIDSTTPFVQSLPSTKDGKIYIFLGVAYSETNIELIPEHPVYWYDGTGIRIWTGAESSGGGDTVTVTQTVSSGTEIAEISVNGNGTKLYTPTIPTNVSAFNNDAGYLTSAPVTSVNGQTGAVSLSIPTKTSDLNNDSGFITDSGLVHTSGAETISGVKTFTDTINNQSNLSMRFYGTSDSGRMQFRAQPSDNVIRGTVAITDGYSGGGSGYTGFVTQLVAREGNTSSDSFNTIRTSNKGVEYIRELYDGTVTVDRVIVDTAGEMPSPAMSGTPTAPTAASGTNTTQVATTAFVQTAVSGLAPLIGTTANTTPSQVLTALQAGKSVYITHTSSLYGDIIATYFDYSVDMATVVSNVIAYVGQDFLVLSLAGITASDTWLLTHTIIPTKTSDLNNDSGFLTSAGAVTSFNGSTGAVTYTAPVTSVNGSTGAVTGLQTTTNLVTSISNTSTDAQYPSAKCVYDLVGGIETLLAAI